MKPRQIPWKWLLLGLITLLIAGLAILPRLLADSTQLASRVTDALSTWTGGEVKLTGPLRVHYFPDVSIKSGFELTNASRLPLVKSISVKDAKVSIDLVELAFGRIRIDALRMLKPEITLKEVALARHGARPDGTGTDGQPAVRRADRRASPARRHSQPADGDRQRSDQEDRCPLRRKLRHRNDVELRLLRVARRDRGLRARLRRCRRGRGRDSRSGQSHLHLETSRRPRSRAPRPSTTDFSSRATYRPTWTTRGASSGGPGSPCRRGGA